MKTRKNNLLQVFLFTVFYVLSILCIPVLAATVSESELQTVQSEGWQNIDGKTYYYAEGRMLTGMQGIEEKTYYFLPETGEMQVGFQIIDGSTFYFSEQTGEMLTGFQEIDGSTYYFEPQTGEMLKDFQAIEGEQYYFTQETGEMLTGRQEIDGSFYYFDEGGALQTGWAAFGGKEYYYSLETGEMLTGRQKIGNKAYYFNEKGVLKTSGWINAGNKTYYARKNGVLQSGLQKISGRTYYFSEDNNKMLTGWQKIKGSKYYFTASGDEKGVMQKNCIAGTKKAGYYYVDDSGIQVTAPEVKKAVKFVAAHSDLKESNDVKLRKCFDALWKSCSYQRFYEAPTAKNMPEYANYMFTNKRGNCFRYAASFAYIAKVLGYESRVYVGSISSARGGMTPHGWTEVKIGGTWYMCDANMQRNHPNISSYMRTDGNYHYRHTRSNVYVLNIRKGMVSWK